MRRTLVLICLITGLGSTVHAQLPIPAFAIYGETDSTLTILPGQALEHVNDQATEVHAHRPYWALFPTDSVRQLQRDRARLWIARLGLHADHGVQAEPLAKVLVRAGDDSIAERVIARRLAAPHLSVEDRAYTLMAAVVAFADASAPARLSTAERYLKQLNAFGVKAAAPVAIWRYTSELAMVDAYDEAGRSADVARHGMAAMHLVPFLGMHDRVHLYVPYATPYPAIVSAVAAQPDGKASIAEMNAILTAATAVMPDSVALDSSYDDWHKFAKAQLATLLTAVARIGTVPGSIPSNRWLNRVDGDTSDLRLDDGHVHVILTAAQGCPGCVETAMHLQTIAAADSVVHPVLITWTEASWANRAVTPVESAALMTDFWVALKQIHYPIALWMAAKRDTLSDGSIVQSLADDSATARYPETGFPQLYVVDGEGRIRASFFTASTVIEQEVIETVHRLAREQHQAGMVSTTEGR